MAELANAKPADPDGVNESARRPIAGLPTDVTKDNRRMRAAWGITLAVLISVPFWAVIAVALYLLL
jgi:hypothetical protein